MTTHEQVVMEEREAHFKIRRAKKAAKVKAERRARAIWPEVRRTIRATGCKCDLRSGMTKADLLELGSGCTDPRFICPALDYYRRRLGA